MLVKVQYHNEMVNAYTGRQYTYVTHLNVAPFAKVIAPTANGDKKALVREINVPESVISEEWRDRLKEITEYDNE